MSFFVPLQLVFVVWLAVAVAASIASSLTVAFAQRKTVDWAPDARHRALLLLAVSPAALATAFVLAVMSPSALALVWPSFDHCLTHPGHVHLCLAHLPERWPSPAVLVGLTFVATYLTGRAALAIRELWRASRLGSRLVSNATDRRLGALVLPTSRPLCLLVGILRPVILLSRGLLASVTEAELDAIIRHERAHAARRDTLTRLVARVAAVFMLPGGRQALFQSIDVAAEQSADETAALALGDRVTMAETILKVERLLDVPSADLRPLAASFGGSSVPLRVTALLEERSDKRSRIPSLLATALVAALFAASSELHHATETLLGFIAH